MVSNPVRDPAAATPCGPGGTWLAASGHRVYLQARGAGFSAWGDYLLNAWTPDSVQDGGGWYLYLRDLDSGEFWTVSGEPVAVQSPGVCETLGATVRLRREHAGIQSQVDVLLAQDKAALELRHLQLTNAGNAVRRLEVTSYLEVVLNHAAAHESHPAFSKLFIQTEWLAEQNAWVVQRRPRGNTEQHPYLAMGLVGAKLTQWSSDRASFLGRGRDALDPLAMTAQSELSRVAGNVLDPALAMRCVCTLGPGQSCQVNALLAVSDQRQQVLQQASAWAALDVPALVQAARERANSAAPAATWQSRVRPLPQSPHEARRLRLAPADPKAQPTAAPAQTLRHFNGLGGFTARGDEYVIRLAHQGDGRLHLPPQPWTNVMANPLCGCVVSETGASSMWAGNSREHRLTPWRNDAISDRHEEAWYVRDEESGEYWSALPGPANAPADYEVTHGQGYTRWQMEHQGLLHETCMFVTRDDPLRIVQIRITNRGPQTRRLGLYGYSRLVLGGTPEATEAHVRLQFAALPQALCARNPNAAEFAARVAFAALADPRGSSWTADRRAFLGQPGCIAAPQALRDGGPLNHALGSQPCAALHTVLTVAPGETREVGFLLGEVTQEEALLPLLDRYRRPDAAAQALRDVKSFWQDTVGAIHLTSPVPEIDLMVNGWLPYQNLSCRLWGRTAFYQSGGAYGFRDQLQDAASLIYLRPDLTRQQILTNAAHQFVEGDVLHWWHPPLSKGMRTRFADDLLWLPLLAAYYVRVTGDTGVLQEQAGFMEAEHLDAGEDERYLVPRHSSEQADIYEHCCRAIDRSLAVGAHGLPLFGCGDWNDGMSRVGREGRGESVWMGFFLYTVLSDFMPMCQARADLPRLQRYASAHAALLAALNSAGWDGQWYRRAWYDNGAPLGSKDSDECQIDALAQAWAVLSGVAPPERADMALNSLEQHLISDDDKLIRLLTPPFVDTPNDPGYIKGYVAGVRENGGQYTHAALWVVKAMAQAGRRQRAASLLKMLSPVHHSSTPEAVQRYQVEPYVIAADVYGAAPHVGRGGWTWYTGSAGWMYRVAIESILGLQIEGGHTLRLAPCIPDTWPGFSLHYRRPDGTQYEIEVKNPTHCSAAVVQAELNGAAVAVVEGSALIPLAGDGATHHVTLVLGEGAV